MDVNILWMGQRSLSLPGIVGHYKEALSPHLRELVLSIYLQYFRLYIPNDILSATT